AKRIHFCEIRLQRIPGRYGAVTQLFVFSMIQQQDLIRKLYAAFNARDILTILATFHPQVRWARAWEGDYAVGQEEVRAYWQRQEVNPHVEPTDIREGADGQLEVAVIK
nr:hypothetical protein [Tanacetum cinerariifolium]